MKVTPCSGFARRTDGRKLRLRRDDPSVNVCYSVRTKQGIVCAEHTRSAKSLLLDEMRKVKNICVAVIFVLFEHLTADGLVLQ